MKLMTRLMGAAAIATTSLHHDENWMPRPNLASSWETSDDSLTVTLHLVENPALRDRTSVTSEMSPFRS